MSMSYFAKQTHSELLKVKKVCAGIYVIFFRLQKVISLNYLLFAKQCMVKKSFLSVLSSFSCRCIESMHAV